MLTIRKKNTPPEWSQNEILINSSFEGMLAHLNQAESVRAAIADSISNMR